MSVGRFIQELSQSDTRFIASSPPSPYSRFPLCNRGYSSEDRHDVVEGIDSEALLHRAVGDLNQQYWQRTYSSLPGSLIKSM